MKTLLLAAAQLAACAQPPAPHDAAPGSDCPLEASLVEVTPAAAAGTTLERVSVNVAGATRDAQLLRLPTADGRVTYAMWIPPLGATAAPAVLMTMPYDGIQWTGEAVDQRWWSQCAAPPCLLPDVDGPGASASPGVIAYTPLTPQGFADQASVHALNGAGVLGVFGRFYAGGSWWQYAQAMVAGLRFLGQEPRVDPRRIGVFGGSLGGYEAFYAAAYAPPSAAPRAVVALYPPVDLAGEERWVTADGPALATTARRKEEFAAFFDPYLRRATVDTGGVVPGGDFRCFSPARVAAKVAGEVLVAWDDWDLLVDPRLGPPLLTELGARGHGLRYRHATPPDVDALPLDHGPFDLLPAPSPLRSLDTFAVAFLHLRLAPGEVHVPFHGDTMGALFARWRDQARAGIEQPGAAARLAELADARVTLHNVSDGSTLAGPAAVASAVEIVWGVEISADQIQAYLRTQGLPK